MATDSEKVREEHFQISLQEFAGISDQQFPGQLAVPDSGSRQYNLGWADRSRCQDPSTSRSGFSAAEQIPASSFMTFQHQSGVVSDAIRVSREISSC